MAKKEKKLRKYIFDILLPDENQEVSIEIVALDEKQAWDKLPLELETKYTGRRWYYSGRFMIMDNE